MVKVSILYPNNPGSHFDAAYYLKVHMPMCVKLLGSALKAVSAEIGLSGATAEHPAPFAAIASFTCDSVHAFSEAFLPHANQLQGDIPNYTDIAPVIQIGELNEFSVGRAEVLTT
jgi:uncharacterized protein (TIGR02118 family)